MSKRKVWLVSVMVGYGKSAQFYMTEEMTYDEAMDTAEDIVDSCEEGKWIRIGSTYMNPRCITTVRVVKTKSTIDDME